MVSYVELMGQYICPFELGVCLTQFKHMRLSVNEYFKETIPLHFRQASLYHISVQFDITYRIDFLVFLTSLAVQIIITQR